MPAGWADLLDEHFEHWRWLTADEKRRVGRIARVIVEEKYWEGCNGLDITEQMQVIIAAQAALLLLGVKHNYYSNVSTILIYPAGYVSSSRRDGAIVSEGNAVLGEAHFRGPVILSWRDAIHGARSSEGRNLVFHEFAHQLDMMDGIVDGTPILRDREHVQRWIEVMTEHFDELREGHTRGVIDPYGATNPAEFFAVTTEAFFERPALLQDRLPELYDVLRDYFGQDTAARQRRYAAGA